MSVELRALGREHLQAARALLADACSFDPAADVAEEKIFGPAPGPRAPQPLGAFDAGELVGLAVPCARWVRLLAVHPRARRRGVGTLLLAAAESALVVGGAARARVMDQPGNYLAPGVAVEDTDTIGWLARRGYVALEENTNLLVDVASNPRVTSVRQAELARACADSGYDLRRAGTPDRSSLVDAIAGAFGRAWAFEVERALDAAPVGVHLATARTSGELAAFAAHDGNNRGLGWFGPAGTLPTHRGRGLGAALLVACLVDVAAAGHARATIAWIGPRDFYERTVGTVGARRFAVLEKDLQR